MFCAVVYIQYMLKICPEFQINVRTIHLGQNVKKHKITVHGIVSVFDIFPKLEFDKIVFIT